MTAMADRVWVGCFVTWLLWARIGVERRPLINRALGRLLRRLPPRLPFPPVDLETPFVEAPLPRVVWMYWHQGEAEAPSLVRTCIDSWRHLNPDWEVRVLDGGLIGEMADLSNMPPGSGLSHMSDMLRVELLARRGGVWADATVLCLQPLDSWLPARMGEGFFAFAAPTPYRPVASWFLAARPGAPLAEVWRRAARSYWTLRGRTDHYFVLHHLFEWMLMARGSLAASWARVPTLSARPPHALQNWLRSGEAVDLQRALELFDDPETPMQKLDWRLEKGPDRLWEALEMQAAGGGRRTEALR